VDAFNNTLDASRGERCPSKKTLDAPTGL
jgi:hypothetical protein